MDYAKKAGTSGVLKKMNARLFDEVSAARKTMCRAMVKDNDVGDTGYTAASEAYLALLAGMMPGGPAEFLRSATYFYWGVSVGPKSTLSTKDTTYEAASVILNLAILEMRKAVAQLATVGRSNAERVEKDCYRLFSQAAGKFQAAYDLMREVTLNEHFPLDAQIDMIEGAKFLCLGQAQECALSKTARDPANRGKALLAKLASQAHQLYQTAVDAFAAFEKAGGADPIFIKLRQFAGAKALGLKVKTFHLQALFYAKENKMAEAKSAVAVAAEHSAALQAQYSRGYVTSTPFLALVTHCQGFVFQDPQCTHYKGFREMTQQCSHSQRRETACCLCRRACNRAEPDGP